MELKQIKELMGAMGRTGISKLVYKREGEYELQLERSAEFVTERLSSGVSAEYEPQNSLFSVSKQPDLHSASVPMLSSSSTNVEVDTNSKYVTSPMVGTFYSSPSPDDPTFVKVGDRIEANTVVCIVEAMKVMNEVKAGVNGVVAEMFLSSGQPVEFGTKLFRVV